MERTKVAVVGAGPLGLMSAKNLKDAGFDVTCFETRPYIGGLWKDSDDGHLSVQPQTVFNGSKFRAPTSDLPFDEDVDDFPTAAQIWDYLGHYADRFGLRPHIHLGCRVVRLLREADDWALEVEETASGKISVQRFDRVCCASGSFNAPRWPKLEGLERFSGKVLHSINFRDTEEFKDKNVLLIGMHATAQDITNALSGSAKKIYMSHRHGLIMVPRWSASGEILDTTLRLPMIMMQTWFGKYLPSVWSWMMDRFVLKMSDKTYPEQQEWGLRPAPSMVVSTPLFSDILYPQMKSGFAEAVTAVREITGSKTVELTDGRVLDNIDAIIYCTGYYINVPEGLIPKSVDTKKPLPCNPYPLGPTTAQNPYLYMSIFPISEDASIRDSLAFMGQGYTLYPGFIQFELQTMAVAQVWRGWRALPDHAEMERWYRQNGALRAATLKKHGAPPDSTFYTGFVPFATMWPFLNRMAGTGFYENLGGLFNGLFNYRAWLLWWRDRELFDLMTRGLLNPAIYRVFETGGRKAMVRDEVVGRLKRDNAIYQRSVAARKMEQDKKLV